MRRWKPSRSKVREFARKMDEIDDFCSLNGISRSTSSDSYYFTVNGRSYRVSNHSVESSNRGAFVDGVKVRELYHEGGRKDDVTYIHASKTRIIEIYTDIVNGYELDGNGNRKHGG